MSEQTPPGQMPPASSGSGSNNNILAAVSYPIPIVGIVILLSDSMKSDPYMKTHAVQSIALGVVLAIASIIIGLIPIVGCLTPILWLVVTIYYAIQAYNAKNFTIPFITDFCKKQGWM
jgi:uncharacterized membrane protein